MHLPKLGFHPLLTLMYVSLNHANVFLWRAEGYSRRTDHTWPPLNTKALPVSSVTCSHLSDTLAATHTLTHNCWPSLETPVNTLFWGNDSLTICGRPTYETQKLIKRGKSREMNIAS